MCKDLQLYAFKTREEAGVATPVATVALRGCEVTPDVNLSQDKFGIRLEVPDPDGMSEMWIRCDSVRPTSSQNWPVNDDSCGNIYDNFKLDRNRGGCVGMEQICIGKE